MKLAILVIIYIQCVETYFLQMNIDLSGWRGS